MIQSSSSRVCLATTLFASLALLTGSAVSAESRPRLIIETDAGGDPDDEQSLVRFLVYANEFDIEGIIANRPMARDGENKNPVRDGLGIVRAMIKAYGECYPNLVKHDSRYPRPEQLLARTVAGYDNIDDGVSLVIHAGDADNTRPVWFSNWGTDNGAAESCLKRALDEVLRERGPNGYAKFKRGLRLSSADKFGDHTTKIDPPFPFWLNASHPPLDGKRWYHRFSALTATAGGFDIERDVRTGHGPLGALYPVNTGLRQKEGDTMMFLYLVPTGMNDPLEPSWGSWGGRYGHNGEFPGRQYYWANQVDSWQGSTHRDNTLSRWSTALQNDFAARMDWCVKEFKDANHHPVVKATGSLRRDVHPGETVKLDATATDPDGDKLTCRWWHYTDADSADATLTIAGSDSLDQASFVVPNEPGKQVHIILEVTDNGTPTLVGYQRIVCSIK